VLRGIKDSKGSKDLVLKARKGSRVLKASKDSKDFLRKGPKDLRGLKALKEIRDTKVLLKLGHKAIRASKDGRGSAFRVHKEFWGRKATKDIKGLQALKAIRDSKGIRVIKDSKAGRAGATTTISSGTT